MADDHGLGAAGHDADLFDDRALFYLQHREQIEEWWNLRSEAAEATHRWLLSLDERVAELGREFGLEAQADPDASDGWAHLFLVLADTSDGDHRGYPSIGFDLGWKPRTVALAGGGELPYVGVRSATSQLTSEFTEAAEPLSKGHKSDRRWPAWRKVTKAEGAWWANLDRVAESILSDYREMVELYLPALRRVVNEGSGRVGSGSE